MEMRKTLTKIKKWREKRYYRAALKYRTILSDYEKEFLVPELKSCLAHLKEHFLNIIKICEKAETDPVFKTLLGQIINPQGLPSRQSVDDLVKEFCHKIVEVAQTQHVDVIDKILSDYGRIESLKELGQFLNEVNLFCSSTVEVKNKTVLFHLQTYIYLVNPQNGHAQTVPNDTYMTLLPIQNSIENVVSVCQATSDTIHIWHKQYMEEKNRFLSYLGQKDGLRNNSVILLVQVTALLFAVILSFAFMAGEDPFNLLKENRALKLKNESQLDHIQKMERDFEELKKSINQQKKIEADKKLETSTQGK